MYKSGSFSSFGQNVQSDAWKDKMEIAHIVSGRRFSGPITLKYKRIGIAMIAMLILIVVVVHTSNTIERKSNAGFDHSPRIFRSPNINYDQVFGKNRKLMSYNSTYPLTEPYKSENGATYRISIITDMDEASKVSDQKYKWQSLLRYGYLIYDSAANQIDLKWTNTDDNAIHLISSYANGGRGMELSELAVFNGRLYSVDDRTGIIYCIEGKGVFPWIILSDGDGHQVKGFKGEWMTTKDQKLHVGGLGKEWTTSAGIVLHDHPQWIKTIDKDGIVNHLNWSVVYKAMQKASGYVAPGYIIHESAVWSEVHGAWFFLPRRASHERYDDTLDEERGTNILFRCSEDFSDIRVTTVGHLEEKTRGFSSFKFVPNTQDQLIVALKTEEYKGRTRSFVTAFTLDGTIIMPDVEVSSQYKYEGIEFV